MTNYFRSGDEIHYDCEIFEQTTSKGQVIRFYFDDITTLFPAEERIATIVYNVGLLINDAELIDDSEYLINVDDPVIKTTGRAPMENAVKAIHMFKECIEALRHKHSNYKIAFACGWLDSKRHDAYKKVLDKMGFYETVVDDEPSLFRTYPAIDWIGYEQMKMAEMEEICDDE